jgi:hypothetical protein
MLTKAARNTLRSTALVGLPPEAGIVVKDHVHQGLWTSRPPLYAMKPSLRNLVHKEAHTRPRRSDHFSERFLTKLRYNGSGRPSLPKFAIRRSNRAKRFSLELKSWSPQRARSEPRCRTGTSRRTLGLHFPLRHPDGRDCCPRPRLPRQPSSMAQRSLDHR